MLNAIRQYLRYTSWPVIGAMLALMVIGVCAVHIAEVAEVRSGGFTKLQILWCCISLGVFVVMTVIPYQKVGRLAYPMFGITLVLLALLVIVPRVFGSGGWVGAIFPSIRGSHRWVAIGPQRLQVSEIAKLSFIIMLAWYLKSGDKYRTVRGLMIPFVLTFVPMGLILVEPDLGTCLLLLPTLYIMLYMAGAKMKHLMGVVLVGTILVLAPVPMGISDDMSDDEKETRRELAYCNLGENYILCAAPLTKMKIHQLSRVDGWLNQNAERTWQGIGWQLHKSKMAIGVGGTMGRGGWNDSETFFRMLPDDHTDFIFSVVAGQWGLLGVIGLFALYCVIFLFGVEIAVITYDPFGRLLAVGVLALLFSQIVINVGMTMGLLPITGMTLPMVSYGGSSLMMNCAALGLLVNVGQHRPISLSRRPFEYDERPDKPPSPYGPFGGW